MQDLFGQTLPQPRQPKPKPQKADVKKTKDMSLPMPGPRVPTGTVAAKWEQHNFKPAVNQLVHFNVGTGYDLIRKKRSLFSKVFGYILEVNHETSEALIHLPKSMNSKQGDDDYYICAFYVLLPIETVPDFDLATYKALRPPIPCTSDIVWNITRYGC